MTKPTSTIQEFCSDHRISRTHLYQLIKDGKGPRVMKLGRRVLITAEAAAEWRKHMEQSTAQAVAGGLDELVNALKWEAYEVRKAKR